MADSGGLQSEDLRHGGCQNCGSLTFSQEWFDVFNVVLCPSCKKEEELITKSSAKENYMLTDGDLKKLGSISRNNPRKKDWSAMRLYLQSQCEKAAFEKHGDLEGIEQHRRGLQEVRQERRALKRVTDRQKEDKELKMQARVQQRLDEAANPAARKRTGEIQESNGSTHRLYDDGVHAEVEEI